MGNLRIKESAHAPLAAALAALIVGVGLYVAVPKDDLSADRAAASPAALAESGSTATSGGGSGGGSGSSGSGLATGSSFAGSTPEEMVAGVISGGSAGSSSGAAPAGSDDDLGLPTPPDADAPGSPDAPEVPACPTETATAASDDLRRQVGDAIGQPVPSDAIGDLTKIAAGCSTESPTGPVLRLALELARLAPETPLPPIQTPGLPLPAPPDGLVPPQVVEALAPAEAVILEACGGIGMLGLLVGLVPSAAGVAIYDTNAVTLVGYGAALCSQFEPPT